MRIVESSMVVVGYTDLEYVLENLEDFLDEKHPFKTKTGSTEVIRVWYWGEYVFKLREYPSENFIDYEDNLVSFLPEEVIHAFGGGYQLIRQERAQGIFGYKFFSGQGIQRQFDFMLDLLRYLREEGREYNSARDLHGWNWTFDLGHFYVFDY